MSPPAPRHLGFLTVRQEGGSAFGGYLVTNGWGRPLEFRFSTPVQPTRVQQILYGPTLAEHLCGEIIGKTLVEKTSTVADVLFTDSFDALGVRRTLETPALWVAPAGNPRGDELAMHGLGVRPAERGRGPLVVHPEYPDDAHHLREWFERLAGFDFAEPFERIRDAIAEARKMGALQRAG